MITVLMPVYNAELFLREAIESILNQTFSDFEFLIINDGSTDSSKKIILSFQDSRIRYIENTENIKLINTLNKGIDLAKGKYIARMDADDISNADRLKFQYEYMENHPETGVCGTWFEIFGDKSGIAKYESLNDLLRINSLYQVPISHSSCIIRKEILEKYNFHFREDFQHAEDFDFFMRMAEVSELANIPKTLLRVREHSESVSKIHEHIQKNNCKKIIGKQFEKIGIAISESEMDLYSRFCRSYFDLKMEEIILVEQLLSKILTANNNSKYLPIKIYSEYIGRRWFHLCYNGEYTGRNAFQIYKKSTLSKEFKPGSINILKFKFRQLQKFF